MYHVFHLIAWLYTALVLAPVVGLGFLLFDNVYKLNYWLRKVGVDISFERAELWSHHTVRESYYYALAMWALGWVFATHRRAVLKFDQTGIAGPSHFLREAVKDALTYSITFVLAFAASHAVAFATPMGIQVDDQGEPQFWVLGFLVFMVAWLVAWYLTNAAGELLGFRRQGAPRSSVVRGTTLRRVDEVQRTVAQNPKRGPLKETYVWGGLQIPTDLLAQHYAVLGESGSGKTLTLEMLMKSVLPDPRYGLRHRALIYDPKREMLPILLGMGIPRDRIMVLQPFDKRTTAWDIAADVTTPAAARETAAILIPPSEKESQPYFTDAARDLLTAVMLVLQEVAPGNWDLNDVIEAMSRPERLEALLSLTPDGQDRVEQHLKKAEVTAGNILSTVRTRIANYETIARLWARAQTSISLEAWFQGTGILLLGCDDAHKTVLDAINRAIFKRVSELITSREENPPDETWIFLDEAREAGELDGLRKLLTQGRSKNAHVVLGFQDLEGFRDVYGQRGADELVGLCGNIAVLRLNNPSTQEWASKYFGEYEYIKDSSGQSYHPDHGTTSSVNFTLDKRLAVMPQEFRMFPPTTPENGLTGVYATPAVGAWSCRILGPFIEAHRGKKTTDRGFDARDPRDQARVPWTDADHERLHLPKKKEAAAPAGSGPGLRTMPRTDEPKASEAAPPPPTRPTPRKLDQARPARTAGSRGDSWEAVGSSFNLGALVLNADGSFRVGGMMNFGQNAELRNTEFNGVSVEKEAGEGKPLTVRTPKGEAFTFKFERGSWYRLAA